MNANGDSDWRDYRDEEGFPVSNEDRAGEIFTHPEMGVWYCTFVEGLGWCWRSL